MNVAGTILRYSKAVAIDPQKTSPHLKVSLKWFKNEKIATVLPDLRRPRKMHTEVGETRPKFKNLICIYLRKRNNDM